MGSAPIGVRSAAASSAATAATSAASPACGIAVTRSSGGPSAPRYAPSSASPPNRDQGRAGASDTDRTRTGAVRNTTS